MIIIIIIIIMIIFFSDLLQMITYQKSFSSVAVCLFVVFTGRKNGFTRVAKLQ